MPVASLVTGTRQPWGPRWGHPERGEGCVRPGEGRRSKPGAVGSGLGEENVGSVASVLGGPQPVPLHVLRKGRLLWGALRLSRATGAGAVWEGTPEPAAKAGVTVGENRALLCLGASPPLESSDTGPLLGGGGDTNPSHEWGRHQEALYLDPRNVRQPGHCPPPQHLGIWVSIQATVTQVLPEARRPGCRTGWETRERLEDSICTQEIEG